MEKLLKYCLSFAMLFTLVTCKEDISLEERKRLSDDMINGGHPILGPKMQGYSKMMTYVERAIELDPENSDAWRELSIPYLKRGIPHKWKPLFDKAVALNSKKWQGWRGYLYLWFYRDYKKAIADFNATDSLTPNFIDAPQGHSVDYWRGIAYLGLKDYKNSIAFWNKHINKETQESGEDWVEINAYLYRGIAHYESGNFKNALENFDTLLRVFKNHSADAKYYKALILLTQNDTINAKKLLHSAIEDFEMGYYNNRPYVETLRQIYLEDLTTLKQQLE